MPVEEQAFAAGSENQESPSEVASDDNNKEETTNAVPFYKLFVFSDFWDKILMLVGTLGAVGNGLNPPLMSLLFGELADAFGSTQTQTDNVVPIVSRVCKYIYVYFTYMFLINIFHLPFICLGFSVLSLIMVS